MCTERDKFLPVGMLRELKSFEFTPDTHPAPRRHCGRFTGICGTSRESETCTRKGVPVGHPFSTYQQIRPIPVGAAEFWKESAYRKTIR